MKYFIKVVYKDRLEPTKYLEKGTKFREVREKIGELLAKFQKDKKIKGIFIGRS